MIAAQAQIELLKIASLEPVDGAHGGDRRRQQRIDGIARSGRLIKNRERLPLAEHVVAVVRRSAKDTKEIRARWCERCGCVADVRRQSIESETALVGRAVEATDEDARFI